MPAKLQPKRSALPVPLEHQIQAAYVEWTLLNTARFPALALGFAVPNAARRSYRLAARMKREGLRSGVPDWVLPVPRGKYTGLMIEFKRPGEKPTQAQKDYMGLAETEGWLCVVCDSTEAAVNLTRDYLLEPSWRRQSGAAAAPGKS